MAILLRTETRTYSPPLPRIIGRREGTTNHTQRAWLTYLHACTRTKSITSDESYHSAESSTPPIPSVYLIVLLVLGLLSFSVPLAIHYPGRISYQRAKTPTLEDMDKWVLRGGSRGTEDMGYFLDVGWCGFGGGGGGGGAGGGGRIWSC